jgi:hypothetical protein
MQRYPTCEKIHIVFTQPGPFPAVDSIQVKSSLMGRKQLRPPSSREWPLSAREQNSIRLVFQCCFVPGSARSGHRFWSECVLVNLPVFHDEPDSLHIVIAWFRFKPAFIRPDGRQYLVANNAYTDSELAGVCFSPDGNILFVNIQYPGMTFAIKGPWPR